MHLVRARITAAHPLPCFSQSRGLKAVLDLDDHHAKLVREYMVSACYARRPVHEEDTLHSTAHMHFRSPLVDRPLELLGTYTLSLCSIRCRYDSVGRSKFQTILRGGREIMGEGTS